MPNGINTLSPDFRDALLLRNLISDTIQNNGLEPLLQGVGTPAEVGNYPESVQASDDIEVEGVYYKDLNVVLNKYQGDDDDYRQASINFLPGNTNSTIGGNPSTHEPYSNQEAELDEYTESQVPLPGKNDKGNIRHYNTLTNMYVDTEKQIQREIVYTAPVIQMGSYLDENNNLNVGGPSTQPLDIVGSILQGGGIGFDPNGGGAVANFDARASLAGRTLTAAGAIEDTRLGQESVGYLAAAIGNNLAFNIQEETLGRVNLNPLSLAKGNSLIVPNYKITVIDGTLGGAVDLLERMGGFKNPFSLLETKSSIFTSESGDIGNFARANAMIANSGKGQILAMFGNLNANVDPKLTGLRGGFVPAFEDPRTERGFNQGPLSGGTVYAYATKLNQDSSIFDKDSEGRSYPAQLNGGFNDEFDSLSDVTSDTSLISGKYDGSKVDFIWGDDEENKTSKDVFKLTKNNKNSILYKTKQLFNSNRMKTLVSGKSVKGMTPSEIQSGIRPAGAQGAGFMSKGSGVLSREALFGSGTSENVFCRTWSPVDKYNQVGDLVRHSGLSNKAPNRPNTNGLVDSVLEDTGFVRIGPYNGDAAAGNIKRFMFSIENLAWADDLSNLLDCEIGPGDVLSGTKGRIMWFPPYDLSFNESTSVNWDRNNFIGRGEPIYTYNNTERTGTLSWKIIIDHPNYINYFPASWGKEEIASWFAGCLEIEEINQNLLTKSEKNAQEVATNKKKEEKQDDQNPPTVSFKIYFPNDSSSVPIISDNTYEDGLDENGEAVKNSTTGGLGTTTGDGTVGGAVYTYPDRTDFGLNAQTINIDGKPIAGWATDDNFFPELNKFMIEKCQYCKVDIKGYASTQGNQAASTSTNSSNNQSLSFKRAQNVANWFKSQVMTQVTITPSGAGTVFKDELADKRYKVSGGGAINTGCSGENDQDRIECKEGRYVEVTISYDASLKAIAEDGKSKGDSNEPTIPITTLASRFFTECNHFEKVLENDDVVYSSIKDKIRHFHPAFHSITPEGFNSRLNFLQQCTRQGPTYNNDGNPNNLAFGRPPVCILRLGDFYHTKIIIDSLSFDFEPLVWDLNPEGIGVQPMIANVSMTFSFIGGSSLNGPVNKLQNAVSYNFFANTELYDPRADRIKIEDGSATLINGEVKLGKLQEAQNKAGANNNNTNVEVQDQANEAKKEADKIENTQ